MLFESKEFGHAARALCYCVRVVESLKPSARLNQQIASLTSDKNALGSQVTNLQNQGTLTNYLIMVLAAVAAVAIGVAVYMSYGKRKLSRKQKETEAPKP